MKDEKKCDLELLFFHNKIRVLRFGSTHPNLADDFPAVVEHVDGDGNRIVVAVDSLVECRPQAHLAVGP